ncbi:hypothetical protein RchiOBHm_Chr4g0426491 [Rosa chinensis]|uniref:Uncharacterized protein n=1 Tax=Rosa chinensis TaxID=74649 RepID=A0A2P6QZD4_ROSCH|nr:hypothetical protein RchiOBHm_Chr4g0426491 [Rosa chinensis]
MTLSIHCLISWSFSGRIWVSLISATVGIWKTEVGEMKVAGSV